MGSTSKISNKLIAFIVTVVLVAVVGLIIFLTDNSVTNDGNRREAGLNAQYLDNQNILSDCTLKIREMANVSKAQSDAFMKAMEDTVKGRYDGREADDPGKMFSVIVEDYPELDGLTKAYERVHDTIMSCRTDYTKIQTKLLDMLREYEVWRTGTLKVRMFGSGQFPSQNLVAQIGSDRSRKGQEALDQMHTIVTVEDAREATESGNIEPEMSFNTNN